METLCDAPTCCQVPSRCHCIAFVRVEVGVMLPTTCCAMPCA